MKGRRKVRTTKWSLKAEFESYASLSGGEKSENQLRFMRIATECGRIDEPVGLMAGRHDADV